MKNPNILLIVQKSQGQQPGMVPPNLVNNMGLTTNLNWLAGFLNHQQYAHMFHVLYVMFTYSWLKNYGKCR